MTQTLQFAIILSIAACTLSQTTRMLNFEHQNRELLFTDNPDTDRYFPKWMQIAYFSISCLMILGGIASCIMCAGNKAGPANPEFNSSGMQMGPGGPMNNGPMGPGGPMNNGPNMNNQSMNGSMMPLNNNRNGY